MKPIYKPKGAAAEYCEYALNIYTGCNYLCSYCYVPALLHKTREEFAKNIAPRVGIVESTKRQLGEEQITGKLIHLCFSCDPYPRIEDTTATREIIKVLKAAGNHVQILTKAGGARAIRDLDLLDGEDRFGVTISCNTLMAKHEEPNASSPFLRMQALAAAKDAGIKTWVSCEPVLEEEAIYRLIEEYSSDIDMYWIGKLNHMQSYIDWDFFGRHCIELCTKYGANYCIKEDLRKEMIGE